MINWKEYFNNMSSQSNDEYVQVGRTRNSQVVGNDNSSNETENHIIDKLSLTASDTLVDVCCGNGLITKKLAAHCHRTIGVDLSNIMIDMANQNNPGENITYIESSAYELSDKVSVQADKISLCCSFQYFESFSKGEQVVLEMIKILKPGGRILITDIPNKQNLWDFYSTWKSRLGYLILKPLGKVRMGRFWHPKELDAICAKNNLKGEYLKQPPHFPFAEYRFDYLIEKKS